nr:hypothetical protein CFP56_71262 [Quercus suber]
MRSSDLGNAYGVQSMPYLDTRLKVRMGHRHLAAAHFANTCIATTCMCGDGVSKLLLMYGLEGRFGVEISATLATFGRLL